MTIAKHIARLATALLLLCAAPALSLTPEEKQQLTKERATVEASFTAARESFKTSFYNGVLSEDLYRKLEDIFNVRVPFVLGQIDSVISGEMTIEKLGELNREITAELLAIRFNGETLATINEKLRQGTMSPVEVGRHQIEIEHEFYVKSGRFGKAGEGATPSGKQTPPPPPVADPAERLRTLKKLLEQGLITKPEYDAQRAEILKSL